MSWRADESLTWFQKFCINVIKCGPVPKHIAFIMDGNRRYARKRGFQLHEGHIHGFLKLTQLLKWCEELGVRNVTAYVFSIDNFGRASKEVEDLMALIKTKLENFVENIEYFRRKGIGVRFIGKLELLSAPIKKLIAEITFATKDGAQLFLNIAIAYSSRDEISMAINTVAKGANSGLFDRDDIDEELLSNCLYTNQIPEPDLLIRTSGETRLSDFLLWQVQHTQIAFCDVLWPDIGIFNFLFAVFVYQRQLPKNSQISVKGSENRYVKQNSRTETFVKFTNEARELVLKQYLKL